MPKPVAPNGSTDELTRLDAQVAVVAAAHKKAVVSLIWLATDLSAALGLPDGAERDERTTRLTFQAADILREYADDLVAE